MLRPRVFFVVMILPLLYGCFAAVVGRAGTAIVVAEDRRTIGTITDDESIELKAAGRIRDQYKEPHVDVTSYNRMVLLTGEAPDAATRTGIENVVRNVEAVRGVY